MDKQDLEPKAVDKRADLYRAISGLLPAGSVVSTYLIERIPDQRLDRLAKYVVFLEERIAKLEYKVLPDDDEFIDLFEDGAIQSSRALSNKRAQYIANAVVPREKLTQIEWEIRKKVLRTLSQVTDLDIQVLEAHLDPIARFDLERELQHPESLSIADRKNLSDKELFRREADAEGWDSHIRALHQHGLLATKFEEIFDRGLKRDDEPSPEPWEEIEVTRYGRLLLGAINSGYPRNM